MTDIPTFPLILCDSSGYLDLIDNEKGLAQTNVLGFLKGAFLGFTAYDSTGLTWTVDELNTTYRINWLTKVLAYTIYNPIIKVTFQWRKGKAYKLDDLKRKVSKQVDKDDDVLTQYEAGKFIKQEIHKSESFSEIVAVLSKYVFKVNEQELLQEQESRK
jgi:hypothetical protein